MNFEEKLANVVNRYEEVQALLTSTTNSEELVKLNKELSVLEPVVNAIQSYNGVPNKSIELNIENTDSKLIMAITDHGAGIAPEIKDKLFKEIVTSKGKEGTGLGLFISYSNLKTQFNGDLTFQSELGKGTTFEITLPISFN